jgi:hypothetical protein
MPELDDRSRLASPVRVHSSGIRGAFFRADSAGAVISAMSGKWGRKRESNG